MPEGDSIHRLATRLRPTLTGATIAELRLRDRGVVGVVRGSAIEEVSSHGKHLLVAVAPKWILRLHLGLRGRVRTWPPRDTLRTNVPEATLVLATDRLVVAAFRTMHAGLHRRDDLLLERDLGRLGPDMLADAFDLDEVVARARGPAFADREIADVLLDQTVAAGIGNVYKNEVLFMVGVHPRTPMRTLDDTRLRALLSTARESMASNLGPGPRATLGPRRGIRRQPGTPRHFVYERAGLPCFRCGTPIRRAITGDTARSTYWCPTCQRA